jgi:hypothetical protein
VSVSRRSSLIGTTSKRTPSCSVPTGEQRTPCGGRAGGRQRQRGGGERREEVPARQHCCARTGGPCRLWRRAHGERGFRTAGGRTGDRGLSPSQGSWLRVRCLAPSCERVPQGGMAGGPCGGRASVARLPRSIHFARNGMGGSFGLGRVLRGWVPSALRPLRVADTAKHTLVRRFRVLSLLTVLVAL